YSIGVKYAFGDYTIGLGYESRKLEGYDREDQVILGGSAKFGDATVKAFYAQGSAYNSGHPAWNGPDGAGSYPVPDTFQDFDQYGVSLDYKFGDATVTAFYRELSLDVTGDATYYGLGASYSLGGGAALRAGIMNVERDAGAAIGNYGAL